MRLLWGGGPKLECYGTDYSTWILPPMDVAATEHYSTWMIPPMDVTATETLQHMDITADERDRYRTLQLIDTIVA